MKTIDDFSEGDGWTSPRISGFDVLHEMIMLEMMNYPDRFADMDHDLFARYELDSEMFHQEMSHYLQNWVDEEYNDFDYDTYDSNKRSLIYE